MCQNLEQTEANQKQPLLIRKRRFSCDPESPGRAKQNPGRIRMFVEKQIRLRSVTYKLCYMNA